MKISVDNVLLFELNDHHKQVICNDIDMNKFDADMKRRLQYILMHKYEQCLKRLRQEWEPRLQANGAVSIPCDNKAFSDLVFAHSDYRDRAARDLAAKNVK